MPDPIVVLGYMFGTYGVAYGGYFGFRWFLRAMAAGLDDDRDLDTIAEDLADQWQREHGR